MVFPCYGKTPVLIEGFIMKVKSVMMREREGVFQETEWDTIRPMGVSILHMASVTVYQFIG